MHLQLVVARLPAFLWVFCWMAIGVKENAASSPPGGTNRMLSCCVCVPAGVFVDEFSQHSVTCNREVS